MKRAKKIIDNVYWVGVRDLNNRHFHGDLYPIDEGCTYNAYLVVMDPGTGKADRLRRRIYRRIVRTSGIRTTWKRN